MIFYAIIGGAKLKDKFGFYLIFSSTGALVEFLYPAILFMNSYEFIVPNENSTRNSWIVFILVFNVHHLFDLAPIDKTNKTPMCLLSVF